MYNFLMGVVTIVGLAGIFIRDQKPHTKDRQSAALRTYQLFIVFV